MATVTFKKVGTGELGAGKQERKTIEPSSGRVWAFSAEPTVTDGLQPSEGSIEITRVRAVLDYQTGKRKVHITIKNTGNDFCDYTLYMIGVKP